MTSFDALVGGLIQSEIISLNEAFTVAGKRDPLALKSNSLMKCLQLQRVVHLQEGRHLELKEMNQNHLRSSVH